MKINTISKLIKAEGILRICENHNYDLDLVKDFIRVQCSFDNSKDITKIMREIKAIIKEDLINNLEYPRYKAVYNKFIEKIKGETNVN
ncbi:MAG: hypothetical protein PHX18_05290 [Candidatus Gastranaerophilales bacterium]|nr:hypothetical protein [Candidatus Gastranaerophilales bacterium]